MMLPDGTVSVRLGFAKDVLVAVWLANAPRTLGGSRDICGGRRHIAGIRGFVLIQCIKDYIHIGLTLGIAGVLELLNRIYGDDGNGHQNAKDADDDQEFYKCKACLLVAVWEITLLH